MTTSRNSSEKQKPKTTFLQNVLMGSIAGATEVAVDHPLWSLKTRLQSGETLTLNPRILYRGIVPNALSMTPITALQVGFNYGFQDLFSRDKQVLSTQQRLTCSFLAGMGSAFVSCPTEMIMTYQSKHGGTFHAAANHLYKQGGVSYVYTGLFATMLREGMFTLFFLGITPLLKVKTQAYCKNDYAASLFAGVGAGIGATLFSQAADTLKTVQQTADPMKPLSCGDAAKRLYSTNGFYSFFKGGLPRGLRVVSAVTLMGFVNEKLDAKFKEYNAKEDETLSRKFK